MIVGLQDVYYYVKDMRRAVAFYRDTLGLRLLSESDHWSVFDVGGVRLGLHTAGGNVIRSSPDENGIYAGATVTLKVRDIRREVERLQRAGVNFMGELLDEPFGILGAFKDPDGNVIKLMEPKPA
jgi:predicted enzyme related to lactoylglutathione lyase